LKFSQGEIRQTLELVGAVAKIEKRADMYVSTLRRFVEAMGGELDGSSSSRASLITRSK
jgi:hypothetical protein